MDKTNLKIFVANDKVELRNIIRDYLKAEGYVNLGVSENGLSAWSRITADPPDLVIADLDLPGLNGLDLLKRMRAAPSLKETPFILISSENQQKIVAQAAEHKVSAYIIKPFSHKTLADKVQRLLERKLNPTELDHFQSEAQALMEKGDLKGALDKITAALDVSRKALASVYYKKGQVHERLEDRGAAEASYTDAVGVSKQYAAAYDALGLLSLQAQAAEQALEYFNAGVKISPLNGQRQFNLGEALMAVGRNEEAEKAFKTALELDPTQTHAFNRLGVTLRRQGKSKEAGEYLLRALEATDDDENLYYNLSRVFLDQNDSAAAKGYLEQALALKPDFKEARDLMDRINDLQPGGGHVQ